LGNFYSPDELDDLINLQNDRFVANINEEISASYNIRSGYISTYIENNKDPPVFECDLVTFLKCLNVSFIDDPFTSNQLVTTSQLCSLELITSYILGLCVVTLDATSGLATDFLRFPQTNNPMATCLYDSPVRFLKNDGRVFCPILVDQVNEVSFLAYLIDNFWSMFLFTDRFELFRITS
jgi:hypothetical protein